MPYYKEKKLLFIHIPKPVEQRSKITLEKIHRKHYIAVLLIHY